MDPATTDLLTYYLPGVPPTILVALFGLIYMVYNNIVSALPSPLQGGSRFYLFAFRLLHSFAGNNGVVRKPPKAHPEVRALGTEGTMAHLMATNEELRLKMAGMEEHLAALNAVDKPAATTGS